MPYATVAMLPVNVRSKYSEKALRAYLAAYNSTFETTKDESRASAAAASAAKRVDGESNSAPAKESKQIEVAVFKESNSSGKAKFFLDADFVEAPVLEETTGVHRAEVKIIRPGLSENKFFYSEKVLADLIPLLEGGKAFLDHETKSEIKDRGGRSVKDLFGWYESPYQDDDGAVRATMNIPPGNDRYVEMLKANPALMGLSINAVGRASRGTVGGKKALIAESFETLHSTDLVTEAAAGGEVVRMVASATMEIDDSQFDETSDTMQEGKHMDPKEVAEKMREMEKELKELKEGATAEEMGLAQFYLAERDAKISALEGALGDIKKEAAEAEKTRNAEVIESKLADIPEFARKYLEAKVEGMDSKAADEEIKKFEEVLKSAPAVVADDVPAAFESKEGAPKPGDENYEMAIL